MICIHLWIGHLKGKGEGSKTRKTFERLVEFFVSLALLAIFLCDAVLMPFPP